MAAIVADRCGNMLSLLSMATANLKMVYLEHTFKVALNFFLMVLDLKFSNFWLKTSLERSFTVFF